MNNIMFCKLAWTNISKNKRIYLPYWISSLLIIVTFFTINLMAHSKSVSEIERGVYVAQILVLGTVVIGFFSIIFIYYTNSIMMKQRKKEIGLYSILGLEKKHIGFVLLYETIITIIVAVGGGILFGLIISKLIFLIMLNAIRFDITIKLEYTKFPFVSTIILYVVVFLITYIKNLFQVHLSNPISLLKGSNKGEREPKASWILAAIGVITLGLGYYIAVTIKNPLEVISYFFIAVILVIIGTHLIFTSASIYLLKFLKRRKGFYYRSNNFISISGMIYRMKQNAAGLANICILSTMVVVCILTTVSLYAGHNDIMEIMSPRDIQISAEFADSHEKEINHLIEQLAKENNVAIDFSKNIHLLATSGYLSNNVLVPMESKDEFYKKNKTLKSQAAEIEKSISMRIMTLDEYNAFTESTYEMQSDQELMIFDSSYKFSYDTLQICDETYQVMKRIDNFNNIKKVDNNMARELYLVVKNMDIAKKLVKSLSPDYETTIKNRCKHMYYIDITGSKENSITYEQSLKEQIEKISDQILFASYHVNDLEWYTTYGGLLFIGVYFGILFLIATVLIIYYKQISEGYDDRERFHILQKVGMSKTEVKRTIHKQILMVFALPLLVAICHTCFALPMLKRLLQIFYMFNTRVTNLCTLFTVIIYACIYVIVYLLTARVYYKIVEN